MIHSSFDIDEATAEALNSLKEIYGVSREEDVLRRALAIALAAAQYSDADNNIHIVDRTSNGETKEVILPQRY